jgi:lipoate-protein ligase A
LRGVPERIDDSRTWYLLRTGARQAAENMAIDDVLLEVAGDLAHPILRFYSWSEPAASFGYSQRYADVAKLTSLRPLVRRPTGGGLVPHDADWTYSLIFPPAAEWYSLKATESYERVHAWVQAAFERLKVSTQLSPQSRKEATGQCFVGAEQFDVLCDDRKIAGAAQRRNRHGLLIQGSIQSPSNVSRSDWEHAFCEVAEGCWGVEWKPFSPNAEIMSVIRRRTNEKFGTPQFTQGR